MENLDSKKLTENICQMLGINPENVNVNCKSYTVPGNDNEPAKDVQQVNVAVQIPGSVEKTESNFVPRSMEKAAGVEVTEKVKALDNYAKSIQEKLKGLENHYNFKENASNLIGQFADSLGNLITEVRAKYQDAMKQLEEECPQLSAPVPDTNEPEDQCECPYESTCTADCNDCPVTAPEVAETEPSCAVTKASAIRENLRAKFNAVKEEQERQKKYELFLDANKKYLLNEVVEKINNEEFSSLTNDLDSEDAGIAITLTKQVTDEIEKASQRVSGYNGFLDATYITDILLPGVVKEIVASVEFHSGAAFLNTIDGSIVFKFLF